MEALSKPPKPPNRSTSAFDSVKKHQWRALFVVVTVAVGSFAIVKLADSPEPAEPPPSQTQSDGPTPAPASNETADPKLAGLLPNSKLRDHVGDLTMAQSNTSVQDVHVTGSLYIMGPIGGAGVTNVTVDNVQVDGCIYVNSDSKGNIDLPVPKHIDFLHVDSHCMFASGFDHLTLDAVNLHDSLNAPQAQLYDAFSQNSKTHWPASNLLVENSWFHGFKTSTTAGHLANVHLGGVQTAMIRNNRFELFVDASTWARTSVTAPFEIDTYAASGSGLFSSNIVFDHNQVYGDTFFLLYFIATGDSAVTDNQFFTDGRHGYAPLAGVQYFNYTKQNTPDGVYPKFRQSGNTLDGRPITLPGGQ